MVTISYVKVFAFVFILSALVLKSQTNAFTEQVDIFAQQQKQQHQQLQLRQDKAPNGEEFQKSAEIIKRATKTTWHAEFKPNTTKIFMKTSDQVSLRITGIDTSHEDYYFRLVSENDQLAKVNKIILPNEINPFGTQWSGNITIEAIFLGSTNVYVERVDTLKGSKESSQEQLGVIIVRKTRIIDHIFTGSVIVLVSLLYINFGAALDLTVLRGILRRPVGPTIGFLTQFGLMPLLSYGLGLALLPDSPEMQLGLFFTGVSPAGGASNIWTVVLGGNVNLSVLMTTIGNFSAFFMMPFWLFTLGKVIFDKANLAVPYRNIATYAVGLVVPLAIGLAIQRCSPKVTRWLVRLLKPISIILILFIIIFAIVTNLYIFQLFSWRIILAGLLLPWLGYLIGWIVSKILRQTSDDSLTIAIETGIQNTGIAIFMLRLSLKPPEDDLTTVMPVAVAIMTPFPLLALYLYRRFIMRRMTPVNEGIDEQSRIVASPAADAS